MIKITPELSEICGIHAGDGYLRGPEKRVELDISGNIEEKEYYEKHIKRLFKKAFNIKIKCRYFESRNTYGFVIRDKKIIEFMHSLGFPYGNKSTIVKVPKIIKYSKDKKVISAFLRGLFDTDGCIHFWKRNTGKYSKFKKTHNYYPIIAFSTVSKELFEDIKYLFKTINLENFGNYKTPPRKPNEKIKYILRFYGSKEILKFFKLINSKNPIKQSRYLVWRKKGYCPSKISYSQRLKMLKT